ncbi:hypothetical protein FRX31_002387 [Thalictrum thalictroides]|uniref:Uncharacterized protein n=1 Tax=Thalictrum thalictroides TaxID=46969 RepID=A0A7J6XDZ3_THATH|nr:hypothetical protein FRX31_002387 [Thalictrum thalictroides]
MDKSSLTLSLSLLLLVLSDLPFMMVSAEMKDVQPPSSTSRIERVHVNLPGPPCRTAADCDYNCKCAFDHCYC